MNDRNKSPLTHEVTTAAALWLECHGFKPVETEVYMPRCGDTEKGWIADLAAVICPTQTELIDLKLLPRKPGWNELHSKRADPKKVAAWHDREADWQKRYESMDRTMTCLVEVKTTRADFRGDRKWSLLCPTDLAYIAVPRGLVRPDEYPAWWGVLEFHDGAMKQVQVPVPNTATIEQKFSVVLQIAIRRDHHTRYARWREFEKDQRANRTESKRIDKVSDVARAMEAVVRGEHDSVETIFKYVGIKNIPDYVMDRIRPLYGIAKENHDK